MEPEQFLHEALGFIAFIVPTVLIIIAAIIALVVAGIIGFAVLVARENRMDRKRDARLRANRLQRIGRR